MKMIQAVARGKQAQKDVNRLKQLTREVAAAEKSKQVGKWRTQAQQKEVDKASKKVSKLQQALAKDQAARTIQGKVRDQQWRHAALDSPEAEPTSWADYHPEDVPAASAYAQAQAGVTPLQQAKPPEVRNIYWDPEFRKKRLRDLGKPLNSSVRAPLRGPRQMTPAEQEAELHRIRAVADTVTKMSLGLSEANHNTRPLLNDDGSFKHPCKECGGTGKTGKIWRATCLKCGGRGHLSSSALKQFADGFNVAEGSFLDAETLGQVRRLLEADVGDLPQSWPEHLEAQEGLARSLGRLELPPEPAKAGVAPVERLRDPAWAKEVLGMHKERTGFIHSGAVPQAWLPAYASCGDGAIGSVPGQWRPYGEPRGLERLMAPGLRAPQPQQTGLGGLPGAHSPGLDGRMHPWEVPPFGRAGQLGTMLRSAPATPAAQWL